MSHPHVPEGRGPLSWEVMEPAVRLGRGSKSSVLISPKRWKGNAAREASQLLSLFPATPNMESDLGKDLRIKPPDKKGRECQPKRKMVYATESQAQESLGTLTYKQSTWYTGPQERLVFSPLLSFLLFPPWSKSPRHHFLEGWSPFMLGQGPQKEGSGWAWAGAPTLQAPTCFLETRT